jgi:hypothetical protein
VFLLRNFRFARFAQTYQFLTGKTHNDCAPIWKQNIARLETVRFGSPLSNQRTNAEIADSQLKEICFILNNVPKE